MLLHRFQCVADRLEEFDIGNQLQGDIDEMVNKGDRFNYVSPFCC